jgi:NAD(P)-dependent dehydrogenase (short-subunit alcohol dehydrogenase family)
MTDTTDYSRRAALVTGGSRGIGRAICVALAGCGFDIAVTDVVEDADAEPTLAAIAKAGGKGIYHRRDLARTDGNDAFAAEVEAAIGPIDCLVNNAGVQVAHRGDLLDVSEAEFDRVVGINLRGTFFLTQTVARAMLRRRAADGRRSIITITSSNAGLVSPEKGPYGISKAALSMAIQQFAVRLGESGIAVHEIRPGLIRTDMTAPVYDDYARRVASGSMSPFRRWGEPEDVARGVALLARGEMPFSTGDIYNLGGGLHIHRL